MIKIINEFRNTDDNNFNNVILTKNVIDYNLFRHDKFRKYKI